MSSELLRRAAALMRERAEAARSYYAPHHPKAGQEVSWFGEVDLYDFDEGDGPHIIGMSPTVALTVADWLEAMAVIASWEQHVGLGPVATSARKALAVARAYLGESA